MKKLSLDEFTKLGGLKDYGKDAWAYGIYTSALEEFIHIAKSPRYTIDNIVINQVKASSDDKRQQNIIVDDHYGNMYVFRFNGIIESENDMDIVFAIDEYKDLCGRDMLDVMNKSLHHYERFIWVRIRTNTDDIKKYINMVTGINEDEINIGVEQPIQQIIVHQLGDMPVFHFVADGKKFIANIVETSASTYQIMIYSSTKLVNAIKLEGVKIGTTYRSVLLKRLNDWYKQSYQKQVTFKWGSELSAD
jgi:hypothetical protein